MKYLSALIVIVLLAPTGAMAGPCTDDKQKFCKDVLGQGKKEEISKCLEQHKAELSDTCKAKVEEKASGGQAEAKPDAAEPDQEKETKP